MTNEEIKDALERCNKMADALLPGPWEWSTDEDGYGIFAPNADEGRGRWVINDYGITMATGDLCILARHRQDLLYRNRSQR